MIGEFTSHIESDVKIIVADNRKILDYYESEDIDCDIESEYRIIKAIDDHYADLWL